MWAGDYRLFHPKIVQIGSAETGIKFRKIPMAGVSPTDSTTIPS